MQRWQIKVWFEIFMLIFMLAPPPIIAEELRSICTADSRCEIKDSKSLITNHGTFTLKGVESYEYGIYIQAIIDDFTNYGSIITYNQSQQIGTYSFSIQDGQTIKNLTNYGTISGGISFSNSNGKTMTINNYGTMGGVSATSNATIIVNNYGTINLLEGKYHFKSVNLTIQNYAIKITEDSAKFNAFSGTSNGTNGKIDNSHLVLENGSVKFAENGKLILDFGGDFEFGAGYLFEKLVVDTSGTNKLPVDISRLTAKDDIFEIAQSGKHFIVTPKPQNSAVARLYSANIRTMNNFSMMTSAMIFPRKFGKSQNLAQTPQNSQSPQKRTIRRIKRTSQLDSANSPSLRESALADSWQSTNANEYANLKQNETFFYKNAESNAQLAQSTANAPRGSILDEKSGLRRRERGNRTSGSLTKRVPSLPDLSPKDTARNYHFIFTPFINHNSFAQAGNYALSGFDYGFITAFSVTLAESHSLGAHFALTYGTLRDKHDKDLAVKNLNLFGGLHYKIDLPFALFLKARWDFYHFSNDLKTQFLDSVKPQNLGFGANLTFGKTFDFRTGGALSIEAGFDYKALKSQQIKADSAIYQNALFNLIYGDLGISYANYFGGFGVNFGVGAKFNLAPKLAKSKVLVRSQNFDFAIDSDKILGYANAGISYLLEAQNFDMEFGVQYFGGFGDRGISNGGG
ncbi:hypothetical protein ACWIUD_02465, partial [Helicobacter sp. 23-1044]